MIINEKKYVLKCNWIRISFQEYSISKKGFLPDQGFIQKILNVFVLTSKTELESILELVNFYRRYLLMYSDLFEVSCVKNMEFIWTREPQIDFDNLKGVIAKKNKL